VRLPEVRRQTVAVTEGGSRRGSDRRTDEHSGSGRNCGEYAAERHPVHSGHLPFESYPPQVRTNVDTDAVTASRLREQKKRLDLRLSL
jgi:hypothetical protein